VNLILLTERDCVSEINFLVKDFRADHIRTVLQAQPGDSLAVGLVNGPTGVAEVISIDKERVELRCDSWAETADPRPSLQLICALPRPQTVKKILFIAGMCAVKRVWFIRANRVEKSFFHSPVLTELAMQAHLLKGMSQGKQTRLPEIGIHERFRAFVETTLPAILTDDPGTLRIIPTLDAEVPLSERYPRETKSVLAAVGPEGGWVDFEREQFTALGFQPVTLGRWVLRVEHAITTLIGQIELLEKDRGKGQQAAP